MTKPLYLSNSQVGTFTDCQRKWYHDKVAKIRPKWLGSALWFGSMLDDTVEHILLKKDGHYLDTFNEKLKNFQVNGKDKKLPEDILDIRFSAGDVDERLVNQDDVNSFCDDKGIEHIKIEDYLEYCKGKRKRRSALEKEEQEIYNYIAYRSLEAKGRLIIEKLAEWIDENVLEVHSVQKKIEIENGCGDKFIGYLDFVVTLKTGKKVLVDLKTVPLAGYFNSLI